MRYEHRQFHFDVQSGMETGTVPFWEHQRTIRDALLQGQYELRECSASRDNKDLFDPLGDIVRKRAEEEKQKLDAPELTETECYRGVLHGAVVQTDPVLRGFYQVEGFESGPEG
ncbi:hypothetical protein AFLA_009698 [Aspergillus flavus NRRL3357]|nr:hypothetical protein AFLA_009698 [Aspergillus flavus NRRL3357]